MVTYFRFYHSESNPGNLTGEVGGSIGTEEIQQTIGDLFATRSTANVDDQIQYRKIFIKQTAAGSFNNIELNLENVEYEDQISMRRERFSGDSSVSPITIPSGQYAIEYSGDFNTPLTLGNSTSGTAWGIWLRQSIPAEASPDAFASFVLQIKGDKI